MKMNNSMECEETALKGMLGTGFIKRTIVFGLLLLSTQSQAFLNLYGSGADATWGFINNKQVLSGYVYTRGIYKSELGYPVYVVYDKTGTEIREIGEVTGDFTNSTVMSAFEYRAYLDQREQTQQTFADSHPGAPVPELISVSNYLQRKNQLMTVGTAPEPYVSANPRENTRSLLVLPETMLYSLNTTYILQEYPVDLTEGFVLDNTIQSLIISQDGRVLDKSTDRISLRSIFFENTGVPEDDADRYATNSSFSSAQTELINELSLVNPVEGVGLSTAGLMGMGVTDNAGHYGMTVIGTPCPLFSYNWDVMLEGQIPYKSFNPYTNGNSNFFLGRNFSFNCDGYGGYVNSTPVTKLDFQIDVNILMGAIVVPGVSLAATDNAGSASTKYNLDIDQTLVQAATSYYDFDLDGIKDSTFCGDLNAEGLFVLNANCTESSIQGIYLSSDDRAPDACPDEPLAPACQPHFTRLLDSKYTGTDFDNPNAREQIATLMEITSEHLQDTDIYIIRKSNGQLVSMRQGLKSSEGAYEYTQGDVLEDNQIIQKTGELKLNYSMLMRGGENYALDYSSFNANRDENGFSDWQAKGNMAPELVQFRDNDHIKTGEELEIWAINRVTGYIGSQDITLGEHQLQFGADESDDDSIETKTIGAFETRVDDIKLEAPNLKIWAERRYDIEAGLTAGQQKKYLISHEGAGEADDTYIQIFVEWLDKDGTALPKALSDYGYTGRLAYMSGENQLTDASQVGNARFSITPGSHAELIRLPGSDISNLHYYIQVNGTPYNEFADFSLSDTQNRNQDTDFEGVVENHYRPEHFVPIKVPQFDEESSTLQEQTYLIEKKRREEADESMAGLVKSKAIHSWNYRPEYQFSIYDIAMEQINLVGHDETDPEQESYTDIKDNPDPKITGADIVDLLYGLQGSDEDRLGSFDGSDQTLVLALGQQEVNVTLTENNTIRFEDLGFLNHLGSQDYLTIALYTNEDAGNLLWEYAFGRNGLHVYYKIPHELNELHDLESVRLDSSAPEGTNIEQAKLVRTLGGMRLKYRYEPPRRLDAGQDAPGYVPVIDITWKFNANGWYCQDSGVDYTNCKYYESGQAYKQTHQNTLERDRTNQTDWSIWWEPAAGAETVKQADWSLPKDGTAYQDRETLAAYKVTLEGMNASIQDFKVVSRLIKPNITDPMQGHDVEMLEALLWQLGLSPQVGSPGSEGARTNSLRSTDNGWTKSCQNEFTNSYDTYYSGWGSKKCSANLVSTEGMVRRFQGRNFEVGNLGGNTTTSNVHGKVGNGTLSRLYRTWRHYQSAYNSNNGDAIYRLNDVNVSWWEIMEQITHQGGVLPYVETSSYSVEKSYTDTIHQSITAEFPAEAKNITRREIYKTWIQQESGGIFWGTNAKNYQSTPFRVHEGGGENEGSMGFNHIVWKRMYGPENGCLSNRGYLLPEKDQTDENDSNVNLYRPQNSFFAFLAAASDPECKTSNGLYKAYSTQKTYNTDILGTSMPVAYCYEPKSGTRCVESGNNRHAYTAEKDTGLNLLGKAVMAYNHGTGGLTGNNYFSSTLMLKSNPQNNADDKGELISKDNPILPVHFNYWLTIKKKTQNDSTLAGYLPFVTYIWKGGESGGYDLNIDGQIADLADDPKTPDVVDPVVETTLPWCFSYGEKEWMEGMTWTKTMESAKGSLTRLPAGRIKCG